MVKTVQEWRARFLEKIKNTSFFSENFEQCVTNFVSDNSWQQNETMQKALEISTLELEQLYVDAYARYESNQCQESEELFRLLVMLDPFVDKYWLGLSACLQLMGRYEEALKGYGVMACLDETSPYSYYYASECLQRLSRNEEGKQVLHLAYQYASASPEHLELVQSIKKEL